MVQEITSTAANVNNQQQFSINLALEDVMQLGNELKHLLVRSQRELIKGDAREQVEQLERWIESYRRGLAAAMKISNSGIDMLTKAREQLALALEEQQRLDDEGFCSTNPESDECKQTEGLAAAIRRMDKLIPVFQESFNAPSADNAAA